MYRISHCEESKVQKLKGVDMKTTRTQPEIPMYGAQSLEKKALLSVVILHTV